MASVLNEDSVEKKLRTVTNTQDSIQTLSLWIIHHKASHARIVELWMKVLKKSASPAHRLTLFYLCNDVVQNCKKRKAFIYNTTFKEYLREAASLVRDASVKGKVERIFNIWGERGVYDAMFIKSLHSVLNGQQVKSFSVLENLKDETSSRHGKRLHSKPDIRHPDVRHPDIRHPDVRHPDVRHPDVRHPDVRHPDVRHPDVRHPDVRHPDVRHPDVSQQGEGEAKDAPMEEQTGPDAEESARILAEFKPSDMIDKVTAFLRQEVEIKSKATRLSHLKIDSTSLETVKQLKDRSVGNSFSSQCNEALEILEDVIKRQTSHVGELQTLLDTLSLSETFYEEQYREARIVANAYRNFGARINNMKKKLDELKKSLPETDSPIPSPDINAPSPENTPPFVSTPEYINSPPSLVNYDNSPPAVSIYGASLQQKSWVFGDTESAAGVASVIDDSGSLPGSPPLEAPSPDGSPPHLNLDAPDNASGSLDSRLASFFHTNQVDTLSSAAPVDTLSSAAPVYTPRRPMSVVTSGRPSVVGEDDGSATPLDDEAPTTPVQDEPLASPPKPSTPPKKENPIDFLSRLISQTQKTPAVKSETQTFLDSLTLLTMASKKPQTSVQSQQMTAASASWKAWMSSSTETSVQSQQMTATPASWKAWMSSSTDNKTSPSQPSSPSSYVPTSSLPSSPETFPSVLPMIPPPVPIPIPPPPSLILGLSLPPPPPPFVLTQALPGNLATPPPSFQQTSPGQKENWPVRQHGQNSDLGNSIGATPSSVLKELLPPDGMTPKTGSHIEHPALDTGNREESTATLRSNAETVVDAVTEFGQKLKQKTSQAALKSHVFVPNPERPNLMTLTVSDDLDEADMIDSDTVMEETAPWSDKVSAVRSRSPSRDKDKSFQQPRMGTWSRGDGDAHVSRLAAGDTSKMSSISSIVEKVKPFSGNCRNSNDGENVNERLGKNSNYWRQIDRKFDQCYKRGNRGRGNFRPFLGNRGLKVGVQAYTQTYKEAFQQYSQQPVIPFFSGPPPTNPRQPGYGQF